MSGLFNGRTPWLLLVGLVVVGVGFRPAWRSAVNSYRISAARTALSRGEPEKALELLEAAEETAQTRADIQYWLAVASRRAQRLKQFKVYLQRAERGGWPLEEIQRQQLLALAQTGQFDEVESQLSKIWLVDASENVTDEVCEAMSRGYLSLVRLNEARYWLEHWINLRPDLVPPRLMLAQLLSRMERFDLVRQQYQEVLQRFPERADVRLKLADSLLEASKLADAVTEYELILRQSPADPGATLGLAQAHMRLGQTEVARQQLADALSTNLSSRQRAKALVDLSSFDLAAGQSEQAIARLTEAEKLWPEEANVQYKLGQCLRQAGQSEAAKKHLDRARELQDLKQRLGLLSQDLVQNSDSIDLRFQIGDVALQLGMLEEAKQWLTSAILMDQNHRQAHARLAEIYQSLGDADNALWHRRFAQTLDDAPQPSPSSSTTDSPPHADIVDKLEKEAVPPANQLPPAEKQPSEPDKKVDPPAPVEPRNPAAES
ncbi:MAG: tetratricopeptide repeat protein [Pirellulales bacterium]